MTNKLLLPNKFKIIGWFILIPSVILAIPIDKLFWDWMEYLKVPEKIYRTVFIALIILGELLVGFSKEKQEDKFTMEIRYSSLIWAAWLNYVLLFIANLIYYQESFLMVMIYSMFSFPLIFIGRFNYLLFKGNKILSEEKYF